MCIRDRGNAQPLLLPAGYIGAALFDVGVVAPVSYTHLFYGTAYDVIFAGDCNGQEQSIHNATTSGFIAAYRM